MKGFARKRRGLDPMIAMVNVVFILLAFFMLGSFRETAPAGFQLPAADGSDTENARRVFVDQAGALSASEELVSGEAVILSADARLEANALIALAKRLRADHVQILGVEVKP